MLWFFLHRNYHRDTAMKVFLLFFAALSFAANASAQISREPETPQPAATPEQIQAAAAMPFRNASLPIEQRVDDLVSRLTLEEKVAQTLDRATAIPRLDIPAYNW